MKKILLWIAGLLIAGWGMMGTTYGFLQERLSCDISTSRVLVSLSSVGEPCMNYVRDIQEAQAEIFETLELLLEYIATSSDPAYWNLLFQEHRQKYEALELLKTKLTTSMTSFESALFARVIDYLMPFWERDITRCSLVRDDLIGEETHKKLACRNGQSILIDDMINSSTFDVLVPLLHTYLMRQAEVKNSS